MGVLPGTPVKTFGTNDDCGSIVIIDEALKDRSFSGSGAIAWRTFRSRRHHPKIAYRLLVTSRNDKQQAPVRPMLAKDLGVTSGARVSMCANRDPRLRSSGQKRLAREAAPRHCLASGPTVPKAYQIAAKIPVLSLTNANKRL
jgi:hypothetical protein